MKVVHGLLRMGGRAWLCSLLLLGNVGNIAWSGDTTVEQTAPPVTQNPPTATTPPLVQVPAGTLQGGKDNSEEKTKKADDKSKARAIFLAVLLKLFDGHRGAVP